MKVSAKATGHKMAKTFVYVQAWPAAFGHSEFNSCHSPFSFKWIVIFGCCPWIGMVSVALVVVCRLFQCFLFS